MILVTVVSLRWFHYGDIGLCGATAMMLVTIVVL